MVTPIDVFFPTLSKLAAYLLKLSTELLCGLFTIVEHLDFNGSKNATSMPHAYQHLRLVKVDYLTNKTISHSCCGKGVVISDDDFYIIGMLKPKPILKSDCIPEEETTQMFLFCNLKHANVVGC